MLEGRTQCKNVQQGLVLALLVHYQFLLIYFMLTWMSPGQIWYDFILADKVL